MINQWGNANKTSKTCISFFRRSKRLYSFFLTFSNTLITSNVAAVAKELLFKCVTVFVGYVLETFPLFDMISLKQQSHSYQSDRAAHLI